MPLVYLFGRRKDEAGFTFGVATATCFAEAVNEILLEPGVSVPQVWIGPQRVTECDLIAAAGIFGTVEMEVVRS